MHRQNARAGTGQPEVRRRHRRLLAVAAVSLATPFALRGPRARAQAVPADAPQLHQAGLRLPNLQAPVLPVPGRRPERVAQANGDQAQAPIMPAGQASPTPATTPKASGSGAASTASPTTPAEATALRRIVVSATRTPQSAFDVPASIHIVSGKTISETHLKENLSEALNRVPGIDIQNRQNYATGIRVSSRGFGARAPYGVRNVRILIDGIPATMPDGTTDTEQINLGDVAHIEVLSGPFSVLYGNASGGVIQVFSKNGPKHPTVSGDVTGGSFGQWRIGASYGGTRPFGHDDTFNWMMNASDFYTGGYREHSAARRQQFYGKYRVKLGNRTSWTLLINGVNEPNSQDPGSLTWAEYHQNPRQVQQKQITYNSRKLLRHLQAGIVFDHRFRNGDAMNVTVYAGDHSILQYLPFSGSFGRSGGGVVDLERKFGGLTAQYVHHFNLVGMKGELVGGFDYEYENEHRKGYVNDFGSIGALRRNENDTARTIAEYAELVLHPLKRLRIDAGVRHNQNKFTIQDLYVTPLLYNDSGSIVYGHTNAMFGVAYKVTPTTNVFFDYGNGFDTPTLGELAYLPNGQAGLNSGLQPMTSQNFELGVKSFVTPNTYLQLTGFHIHTNNTIVVATSNDGRTAYQNLGETKRNGIDASIDARLPQHLEFYASYSLLKAFFQNSPAAGAALPGVPQQRVYAEADWHDPASGFYTRLTGQWQSLMFANDSNSAYAPSYFVANWAGGFKQTLGKLRFNEFVRVNNILNRSYIGAVQVNDSFGAYYQPAPTRNVLVGVSASYRY